MSQQIQRGNWTDGGAVTKAKGKGKGKGKSKSGAGATKLAEGVPLNAPRASGAPATSTSGRFANVVADPYKGMHRPNFKAIGCKDKRTEVYQKHKREKRKVRDESRKRRQRMEEELGALAPPKRKQKTLENTREKDLTWVGPQDAEVLGDEADDEFARYFTGELRPKVLVTTRPRPSGASHRFITDLRAFVPGLEFYKRGKFELKQIVAFAAKRAYTHVLVVNEKRKKCNQLIVCHLPGGPTAHFKLTSVQSGKDIVGHGRATKHRPSRFRGAAFFTHWS